MGCTLEARLTAGATRREMCACFFTLQQPWLCRMAGEAGVGRSIALDMQTAWGPASTKRHSSPYPPSPELSASPHGGAGVQYSHAFDAWQPSSAPDASQYGTGRAGCRSPPSTGRRVAGDGSGAACEFFPWSIIWVTSIYG